jgi:hypothetical protein
MVKLKTKTLALVALLIFVILILIGLAFYFLYIKPKQSAVTQILGNGEYLVVSSDAAPFFSAVKVDIVTGSSSPISMYGQGIATIVSESTAASSSIDFYLLSTPDFESSNLFKEDSTHPSTGLFQLTFSNTFKYNLSYDDLSQSAAYEELTTPKSTPHVMYYSPATKKEIDLGEGTSPTVLQGGFLVVFRQGNSLISENAATLKTYTLLSLATSTVFAVDPIALKIALYNPSIKEIQYFSIANKESASYLSSIKVQTIPTELLFADGKLLTFTYPLAPSHQAQKVSMQVVGSSTLSTSFPSVHYLGALLAVPNYSFSIQHE